LAKETTDIVCNATVTRSMYIFKYSALFNILTQCRPTLLTPWAI